MKNLHLKATEKPLEAIQKVMWSNQPQHLRMYQTGYEKHFNHLPVITHEESSEELNAKIIDTQKVMRALSRDILEEGWALREMQPSNNGFNRTIIAMEEPTKGENEFIPGAQIVITRWGNGHTSPVHGHSAGYMHEEILSGKMQVNTYKIVDAENKVVIPQKTVIVEKGVFVSDYAYPKEGDKRQTLIHNFTSIGNSVSMHYLPEYTRDGRDNTYNVLHFSDVEKNIEVERITSQDGMYLQPGNVVLVRSTNVPEYGDHYIVVTGPPIVKQHGLRVQDVSIIASPKDSEFLDTFEVKTGLILLKLKPESAKNFRDFHGIKLNGRTVTFSGDECNCQ